MKTKEIYGELQKELKKSVKEIGYEETKKRYIRKKRMLDWACFVVAILATLLFALFKLPNWLVTGGLMIDIFLPIYLLQRNYDTEFNELIEIEGEQKS